MRIATSPPTAVMKAVAAARTPERPLQKGFDALEDRCFTGSRQTSRRRSPNLNLGAHAGCSCRWVRTTLVPRRREVNRRIGGRLSNTCSWDTLLRVQGLLQRQADVVFCQEGDPSPARCANPAPPLTGSRPAGVRFMRLAAYRITIVTV